MAIRADWEVHQGDVYYARIPENNKTSIQGGTRPVVIISSDWLNGTSPVFKVVEVTSKIKNPEMPTHVVLPLLDGLPKQSMVIAEQWTTLSREDLLSYRCTLSDEWYAKVNRALRWSIRSFRVRHKNRRKRYRKGDQRRKSRNKRRTK